MRTTGRSLVVVDASVTGYGRPFRVLIDSGASHNFARKQSLAESPRTLQEAAVDSSVLYTVRLADGHTIKTPKVEADLRIRFSDFDVVEKFLVLELDARYDLILGWKPMSRGSTGRPRRSAVRGMCTRTSRAGIPESQG